MDQQNDQSKSIIYQEMSSMLSEEENPIRMNRFTLSFTGHSAHLEQRFIADYNSTSLPLLRFGILAGAFFIAMFAILDHLFVPEMRNTLWAIRFFFMIPTGLIVLALSYLKRFLPWIQIGVAAFVLVAGLGIIYMTMVAPSPANYTYYAGLILVTMFVYAITKLRFIYACITSWMIFVFYNFAALYLVDTSVTLLINNNFFLFTANCIGMIMGYLLEYSTRKNFYLQMMNEERHALELEASMLRTANKLAATVAHEFNTPLCVIENIYNLTELKTVSEADWREQLPKIPTQVEKMKKLVEKLLAIREIKDVDYAAGMKILDIHLQGTPETDQEQSIPEKH